MATFDRISSSYDLGMLPLEWIVLRRLRRQLFPHLVGDILEIGVGTGVNLPFYRPRARVTAIDTSLPMLIEARARHTAASILWLQADASAMPFPDGSFDRVVGSLVFCSIDDPKRALVEIQRVLRDKGWLILLEHVRGKGGLVRWLTDRLASVWLRWSESCHLDRETAESVREAGFEMVSTRRHAFGVIQTILARKA